MINKLEIECYRKLKNMSIDISSGINIISGTNGTCKSSILYMVSNAFQEVKTKSDLLKSADVINTLKSINNGVNLKIERLTKGDETYNDPAPRNKGTLFTCFYEDGIKLEFRRHNTKVGNGNRFALKPLYKKGTSDKLPAIPVIYLGLSRLYAFGEYGNDDGLRKVRKRLPDQYIDVIGEIYKKFTGVTITNQEIQEMGDIKKRSKFLTNKDGIDSNTISAGEDNLLIIITTLVSLRYYYDNIDSRRRTESILLIDEIDATLHPAYQVKLLDLFLEYTNKYKIKLIFTTHSLSLLEYAFIQKCNVIYLLDNETSVIKMQDVDIYKIKMFLHNQAKEDIYINRSIPIFTEDREARLFLQCLFEQYERTYGEKFRKVRCLFHMVDANISGDELVNIFKDGKLLRSTMRSICILDGDKDAQHDLRNYTIALPGKDAPEKIVFNYARELYEKDDVFWQDTTVCDLGYTKVYFRDNVMPDIYSVEEEVAALKAEGKSAKGVTREKNKKVFNDHIRFFELIMKKWISDHSSQINSFYKDLRTLFMKVSEFHDISSKEWEM